MSLPKALRVLADHVEDESVDMQQRRVNFAAAILGMMTATMQDSELRKDTAAWVIRMQDTQLLSDLAYLSAFLDEVNKGSH